MDQDNGNLATEKDQQSIIVLVLLLPASELDTVSRIISNRSGVKNHHFLL